MRCRNGSQEAQGRSEEQHFNGEGERAERGAAPGSRDADEADNDGALVGTVEVSIAASTRTRFLTLNAPEASTESWLCGGTQPLPG